MGNGKPSEVEFVCDSPAAKDVYLAGTFNNWEPKEHRLSRNKRGEWRTTLILDPGRYEYKFVIDGKWMCSPHCGERGMQTCPHCVQNAFGTMNRILIVS